MARCVVCGAKAGFLRSAHPECLRPRPHLEPEVVQEISRKLWLERKRRPPRPLYWGFNGALYRAADAEVDTPLEILDPSPWGPNGGDVYLAADAPPGAWVPAGKVLDLWIAGGNDTVPVSPANLERMGVPK